MFTIDLLKGQGLPIKSRPGGIALSAVGIAVPVIAMVVLLGCYLRNQVVISVSNQQIRALDTKIEQWSDALEQSKKLQTRRSDIQETLDEVSMAIERYAIQWSPILVEVVSSMPESVVLSGLEVKESSVRREVPKKDDPEKKKDIMVPQRTLCIDITGESGGVTEAAVREFRDKLRHCEVLRSKLDNIRVSQEVENLENRQIVHYRMDCIFKPPI